VVGRSKLEQQLQHYNGEAFASEINQKIGPNVQSNRLRTKNLSGQNDGKERSCLHIRRRDFPLGRLAELTLG